MTEREPDWITQTEAAALLGWRPDRLSAAVRRGKLTTARRYVPGAHRYTWHVDRGEIEQLRTAGSLPGYAPYGEERRRRGRG